jgi:hypothetical protein
MSSVAEEMVDYTPHASVLVSYTSQRLSWANVLGELVDNSFDAAASQVKIKDGGKDRTITVQDDGRGAENITSLVVLGEHVEHKAGRQALGMYGVGAKDAWLWCGGRVDIDSVHAGIRSTLSVDYRDLIANNWKGLAPRKAESSDPSGMKITLHRREGRNRPDKDAFQRLAFLFTPALSSGRQITVNVGGVVTPLVPARLPVLQDVVNSEFDVAGKSVRICIGIVPEGQHMANGPFWVQYGHRIINETALGAASGGKSYSASRLGGTIVLGKGWRLTKNKDDLGDYQEQLGDAIFSRIEPLLVKSQTLSESIESQDLRTKLECALNSSASGNVPTCKEKRSKGQSHGAVEPAGSIRQRRSAAQTQPGNGSITTAASRGSRRGFGMDWGHMSPDTIGKFDGSASRVVLNLDHPFVAGAKATTNEPALLMCCWTLIAHHDATTINGRKLLRFACDDVVEGVGRLAVRHQVQGGRNEKDASR